MEAGYYEDYEDIDPKIDILLRSRMKYQPKLFLVPQPTGWVWEMFKRIQPKEEG